MALDPMPSPLYDLEPSRLSQSPASLLSEVWRAKNVQEQVKFDFVRLGVKVPCQPRWDLSNHPLLFRTFDLSPRTKFSQALWSEPYGGPSPTCYRFQILSRGAETFIQIYPDRRSPRGHRPERKCFLSRVLLRRTPKDHFHEQLCRHDSVQIVQVCPTTFYDSFQ